jgi:hypothetical protein
MPDPVKISDLPVASIVLGGDILPVVDSGYTQTRRCTAAQIAAIGGGPPGAGTVTAASLASGAVTYAKIQNVTGDRVLGKTAGASGVVEEIPCTTFARTLLAAADSNAARVLINDTPTFSGNMTVNGNVSVTGSISASGGITGQVQAGDGTASAPSYSFAADTNTGLARLNGADSLSLVTGGVQRLRVEADGSMRSHVYGDTALLPHFGCRAFAAFHSYGASDERGPTPATTQQGNVSSISRTSVGYHLVNFATPMPDTNYAVVSSANYSAWASGDPMFDDLYVATPKGLLTTGFRILTGNVSNTLLDCYVYFAIFR